MELRSCSRTTALRPEALRSRVVPLQCATAPESAWTYTMEQPSSRGVQVVMHILSSSNARHRRLSQLQ